MENNRCFGCMQEKQEHPVCEHCGFDERQQNLPHQLPTGTILQGHYLMGRVLGQGGFGITYLAWDLYLQVPIAIKEYYPGGFVTRDASLTSQVTCCTEAESEIYEKNKARFLREGQALAKLQDLRNIVRIYSFFPENNTVYMVMEYVRGHTLQQELRDRGTMRLPRILELLTPVMQDLEKIHQLGLVHRDISPDNIMLPEGGGAKLLDFGAVYQMEAAALPGSVPRSTEAILKQGFAPIEQYNAGGELGPWTDVYALCATICYCLSGNLPRYAPDRVYGAEPEGFIDLLPIGEAPKAVLRRGMAIRPQDRIASAGELLEGLQESLQEKPKPPRPEPPRPEPPRPEPPRPEPPRPRPPRPEPTGHRVQWQVLAVILGVVLAAAAALLILPGRKQEKAPVTSVSTEIPEESSAETEVYVPETAADVPFHEDLVLQSAPRDGSSPNAFDGSKKKEIVSIWFLPSLDRAPFSAVDVSQTGNGQVLAWREYAEGGERMYIAGNGKVFAPSNCRFLFGGMDSESRYTSLREIRFSNVFDCSSASDISMMFSGCCSLEQLDLTPFRDAVLSEMEFTFFKCSSLESLDLSCLQTGEVWDMQGLFSQCTSLRHLDLTGMDTGNTLGMESMFYNCSSLERLDLSSFAPVDGDVRRDLMFVGCDPELELITEDERLRYEFDRYHRN